MPEGSSLGEVTTAVKPLGIRPACQLAYCSRGEERRDLDPVPFNVFLTLSGRLLISLPAKVRIFYFHECDMEWCDECK